MTPKEKAIELRDKFRMFAGVFQNTDGDFQNNYLVSKHVAKRAAIFAAEEAKKAEYNVLEKFGFISSSYTSDYWQEVKAEIEKL